MDTELGRLKRNEYMRVWKRRNKERVNGYKRNWESKNRELARSQKGAWKHANKAKWLEMNNRSHVKMRYLKYERTLWGYAKRHAEKKGLEFDLEVADIVIPDRCPVLGIPIEKPGPGGRRPHGRPSIDRRDNSKGYTRDNVAVVSWRANRLKGDASIAELEAILAYMKQDAAK